MQLEQEWEQYPVLHIDLSVTKGQKSPSELRNSLLLLLDQFVDSGDSESINFSPGFKLDVIIRQTYKRTGKLAAG